MVRIYSLYNNKFQIVFVSFYLQQFRLYIFCFLSNIVPFLKLLIILYILILDWQNLPAIQGSSVKMIWHSSGKLIVYLLVEKWSIPRPSQVVVRIFDNLFICYLRYLYILYLEHIQHISHDQGQQLLCICLSAISMRQLS